MELAGFSLMLDPEETAVKLVYGVDMQAPMPVVAKFGRWLVFRRDGFSGWSRHEGPSYNPPVYYLVCLGPDPHGRPRSFRIETVVQQEASRSTYARIRRELTSKACHLAAKDAQKRRAGQNNEPGSSIQDV